MPLGVAVQDGAGVHHLGVEQRAGCQQPVEVPAVPVGPVHHRRHAQAAVEHRPRAPAVAPGAVATTGFTSSKSARPTAMQPPAAARGDDPADVSDGEALTDFARTAHSCSAHR